MHVTTHTMQCHAMQVEPYDDHQSWPFKRFKLSGLGIEEAFRLGCVAQPGQTIMSECCWTTSTAARMMEFPTSASVSAAAPRAAAINHVSQCLVLASSSRHVGRAMLLSCPMAVLT